MKKYSLMLYFLLCLSGSASANFYEQPSYDPDMRWNNESGSDYQGHTSYSLFGWKAEPSYNVYGDIKTGYEKIFHLAPFQYSYFNSGISFGPIVPLFETPTENLGEGFVEPLVGVRLFNSPWLNDFRLELSGHFFRTEKSIQQTFQNSGGFIYTPALTVTPGSTDVLITVSSIYDTRLFRTFSYEFVDLTAKSRYFSSLFFSPIIIEPVLSVRAFWENQTFAQSIIIADTLTVVTSFAERLDTKSFDFGGGLSLEAALPFHFSLFLKGLVYGSHAETALKADQFLLSFGNVNLDLKKHNFSAKFETSVGLCYHAPRLDIGFVWDYKKWTYNPGIANPEMIFVNDDPGVSPTITKATSIRNNSSDSHAISIQISTPF